MLPCGYDFLRGTHYVEFHKNCLTIHNNYATLKYVKGKPPIEKNVIHKSLQVNNKGEIPIEKNISVVDEQGNEYEATYPKRAKGLVKSGRARFISENRICLASPPAKLSEVNNMENINNKANATQVKEAAVTVIEAQPAEKPISAKYTLEYALEQLEKVREEEETFSADILQRISEVHSSDAEYGDVGAQAKGMALEELAKEHEQTTRKLIDFYLGMVNELKPKEPKTNRSEFLDFVKECVAKAGTGAALPDFEKIWHVMNQ